MSPLRYECLVGYTPFYDETPQGTCRKILRWEESLVVPESAGGGRLSRACVGFVRALLAAPRARLGARGGLEHVACLLYTSPSPRDATLSRMPSSA